MQEAILITCAVAGIATATFFKNYRSSSKKRQLQGERRLLLSSISVLKDTKTYDERLLAEYRKRLQNVDAQLEGRTASRERPQLWRSRDRNANAQPAENAAPEPAIKNDKSRSRTRVNSVGNGKSVPVVTEPDSTTSVAPATRDTTITDPTQTTTPTTPPATESVSQKTATPATPSVVDPTQTTTPATPPATKESVLNTTSQPPEEIPTADVTGEYRQQTTKSESIGTEEGTLSDADLDDDNFEKIMKDIKDTISKLDRAES